MSSVTLVPSCSSSFSRACTHDDDGNDDYWKNILFSQYADHKSKWDKQTFKAEAWKEWYDQIINNEGPRYAMDSMDSKQIDDVALRTIGTPQLIPFPLFHNDTMTPIIPSLQLSSSHGPLFSSLTPSIISYLSINTRCGTLSSVSRIWYDFVHSSIIMSRIPSHLNLQPSHLARLMQPEMDRVLNMIHTLLHDNNNNATEDDNHGITSLTKTSAKTYTQTSTSISSTSTPSSSSSSSTSSLRARMTTSTSLRGRGPRGRVRARALSPFPRYNRRCTSLLDALRDYTSNAIRDYDLMVETHLHNIHYQKRCIQVINMIQGYTEYQIHARASYQHRFQRSIPRGCVTSLSCETSKLKVCPLIITYLHQHYMIPSIPWIHNHNDDMNNESSEYIEKPLFQYVCQWLHNMESSIITRVQSHVTSLQLMTAGGAQSEHCLTHWSTSPHLTYLDMAITISEPFVIMEQLITQHQKTQDQQTSADINIIKPFQHLTTFIIYCNVAYDSWFVPTISYLSSHSLHTLGIVGQDPFQDGDYDDMDVDTFDWDFWISKYRWRQAEYQRNMEYYQRVGDKDGEDRLCIPICGCQTIIFHHVTFRNDDEQQHALEALHEFIPTLTTIEYNRPSTKIFPTYLISSLSHFRHLTHVSIRPNPLLPLAWKHDELYPAIVHLSKQLQLQYVAIPCYHIPSLEHLARLVVPHLVIYLCQSESELAAHVDQFDPIIPSASSYSIMLPHVHQIQFEILKSNTYKETRYCL